MRRPSPGRLALAATLLLVAFAFIGRAVISADDGADILADTLGFLVQGRFESAAPPPTRPDPYLAEVPFGSRYGVVPSALALVFVGPVWPFRESLGPAAVDAAASLMWATGCVLAAFAFLRLARTLAPAASPLWAPAFLGGTFLWAYAADSYVEPWSAAGLAWAAAGILSKEASAPARAGLSVAAGCLAAFFLRTVVWVVAPVFFLAALVAWKARPDATRRVAWLLAGLSAGVLAVGLSNVLARGSATDFGYGTSEGIPFVHDVFAGLLGFTLHPGRGLLFYAPIVAASVAMARRASLPARLLCFGAPLVLALVTARWYGWHGGCCWGPRLLVPVLPLLAVPAVLAPRRVAAALLAVGFVLNLPGVLVASGAWQGYVERLAPPPHASWPSPGGDRASEVVALTPLVGHPWLLAHAVAPGRVGAPWLRAGAREGMTPPPPAGFLSPLLVRRLAGLPPVPPFLARLLVRGSRGYLLRGRPAEAALFAREALRLQPGTPGAAELLTEANRLLAASRGGTTLPDPPVR